MSAGLTGLLLGVGVGAWIYNQFMKRSNNAKTSIIAAILVGGIAFIVIFTAFHAFAGKN